MIKKLWYKLTASFPRPLPRTPVEYLAMTIVLVDYFGLDPDDPGTWATVAGQIQGTPITKMRKSYKAISNAAKRGKINGLAEDYKRAAFKLNNERIAKAMEALKDVKPDEGDEPRAGSDVREWSPNSPTPMPTLSDAKEELVQLP